MSEPAAIPEADRALELFETILTRERAGEDPQVESLLDGEPRGIRVRVEAILADYRSLRRRSRSILQEIDRGRDFGGFRLVREIGRGAMGIVWEAEQASPRRRVALKILRPRLRLSTRTVERFRREAQAGGRLAHPAIVSVHAVGEDDGVPWIAQELVPGGRTLADRLAELKRDGARPDGWYGDVARLFLRLAEALALAHENGIVHRDVKPSNVLLTADGEPKLADFGLALVDDELSLSRTGELAGTPSYASPEQIEGRSAEIDGRSDVFSLGVSLYETLTLSRPFEGDSAQDVGRRILHHDPPDPRTLRARVPADLALICLTALEKRPERRYGTMRALADDLGRHLRHEPIRARRRGPVSHLAKWSRRHPTLASALSLGIVALVVVSLLLAQNRSMRVRAERERATALETARRQAQVLRLLDPGFVARSGESRSALVSRAVEPARGELPRDPRTYAPVLAAAALVLRRDAELGTAETLLGEALAACESRLGPRDPTTVDVLLDLAAVHEDRYELARARSLLDDALDRLLGVLPLDDPLVVDTAARLYLVCSRLEDVAAMEALDEELGGVEQALVRAIGEAGPDGAVRAHRLRIALSRICYDERRFAESLEHATAACDGLRSRLGDRHLFVLQALEARATALYRLERHEESEAVFRELLRFTEQSLDDRHPLVLRATWGVGQELLEQWRIDEAEPFYREVVARLAELYGEDDPRHLEAKRDFGVLLSRDARWSEAEAIQLELLPRFERVLGPDHSSTLIVKRSLVEIYHAQDRAEDARRLIDDQLERHVRVRGEEHVETHSTLVYAFRNALARGEAEEAVAFARRALAIAETIDRAHAHGSLCRLADGLIRAGRIEEARAVLARATAIGDADDPRYASQWHLLGDLRVAEERWEEAEASYRKLEALIGTNTPNPYYGPHALARRAIFVAARDGHRPARPIASEALREPDLIPIVQRRALRRMLDSDEREAGIEK